MVHDTKQFTNGHERQKLCMNAFVVCVFLFVLKFLRYQYSRRFGVFDN